MAPPYSVASCPAVPAASAAVIADAALVGYAVGSVFAFAAVVYRYTLWITRPPTWRNFRQYTAFIPAAWWTDIFAQTFILKRSLQRWVMVPPGRNGPSRNEWSLPIADWATC